MLINLIPKVFYDHLQDALDLFVSGLGFEVLHQDGDLAVVARDGAKVYLVESLEFAAKDRPELAIETDSIDALFAEISFRAPRLLHRNGATVTLKPWGAREFAVLDKTDVCVVFRQWPAQDRALDSPQPGRDRAMNGNTTRYEGVSLASAHFEDVNLDSANFIDVNLANASFSDVSLAGARFHDINLANATITDANIKGMTINGIAIDDLIRAHRFGQGKS